MLSVSTPACSRNRAKKRIRIPTAIATTSIYSGDEYVDFLAGVEGALDRGPGALRAPVPERDQHIACIDKALVASRRLASVGKLVERGWNHLHRNPFLARRLGRRGVDPAGASRDDRGARGQGFDVFGHAPQIGEVPAPHDRDSQSARGGATFADHADVLLEHPAQLLRLSIVVLRVGPAVARVQYFARHAGHPVRNL